MTRLPMLCRLRSVFNCNCATSSIFYVNRGHAQKILNECEIIEFAGFGKIQRG